MIGVRAFLLLIVAWLFKWLARALGRLPFGKRNLEDRTGGRIARNLLVGIIALAGMHFFGNLPMIKKTSENAMDWMIRMNAGTAPSGGAHMRPFVFVDIDERSYREWGEPLYVPRDKLLRLIRAAVDGKAAAVLVDVELSRAMGPDDHALETYLASLDAAPQGDQRTTVLLARGMRPSIDGAGHLEERGSFLDSTVERSGSVRWGSTAYALDDDGAVRRWRLWELVCQPQGKQVRAKIIPSAQLQVLAALDENPAMARWRAHSALTSLTPDSCERTTVVASNSGFVVAGVPLTLRDDELGRRILYAFPWKLKEGEARQTIPWRGHADYPLLTVRSAYSLSEQQENAAAAQWEGQIVVIGASFADSRDGFMTPLGEMPGALVLINTLQSLLQHGETHAPPLWLMLIAESVVVLLLSIIFAYFSSFWGVIVSGAVVIFGMVPASFILFKEGVWLNFALPVVVVQLMQLGDEFKSLRKRIPPARAEYPVKKA